MPLTEEVRFKTALERGNRLQVPKLIRWQFKMEPTQDIASRRIHFGSVVGMGVFLRYKG